jgi:hypothetical protein
MFIKRSNRADHANQTTPIGHANAVMITEQDFVDARCGTFRD